MASSHLSFVSICENVLLTSSDGLLTLNEICESILEKYPDRFGFYDNMSTLKNTVRHYINQYPQFVPCGRKEGTKMTYWTVEGWDPNTQLIPPTDEMEITEPEWHQLPELDVINPETPVPSAHVPPPSHSEPEHPTEIESELPPDMDMAIEPIAFNPLPEPDYLLVPGPVEYVPSPSPPEMASPLSTPTEWTDSLDQIDQPTDQVVYLNSGASVVTRLNGPKPDPSKDVEPGPSSTKRSHPPPSRKGKKRKSPEAESGPSSHQATAAPPQNAPGSSRNLDPISAPWEPVDDIGYAIQSVSDQPANVAGHFCDLFMGIHTILGKVALKRPRIGSREYNEEDIRHFRREADTWRRLIHEHVLPFIGTCKIGNHIYMVSPFIEHGTLNNYTALHPEVDRTRLLYETAEAIAYLHRSGVIHGDIKSSNILVSDTVHVLLCDFGLSKLASSSTATALQSAGSLRWQAPELWDKDSPKTYKSDVYSFGMTVAEVLSGRIPFAKYEQPCTVIRAVSLRDERPEMEPRFSPMNLSYEHAWAAAAQCWHKDPTNRPPISEVARMLEPHSGPSSTSSLPHHITSLYFHQGSLTLGDTSVGDDDTQMGDDDERTDYI